MSQDIHAWIEVHECGRWHLLPEPQEIRNYAVFDLMANTRGVLPHILLYAYGHDPLTTIAAWTSADNLGLLPFGQAAKGMPDDPSDDYRELAQFGEESTDWHSHSWLTLDEMERVQRQYAALPSAEFINHDWFDEWRLRANRSGTESPEAEEAWTYWMQERVVTGSQRDDLDAVVTRMRTITRNGCDCRLVFFFDN